MQRKSRPYVETDERVLMDAEVFDHVRALGLRVVFDTNLNDYPLVVNRKGGIFAALHIFTVQHLELPGHEKLGDGRYVVHHKRGGKLNNRAENLAVLLRADHARVHRQMDAKKSEDLDVTGFWRPHEKRPLHVLDPQEPLPRPEDGGKTAVELYVDPRAWDDIGDKLLTTAEQLHAAEKKLEAAYQRLDEETRHLDSGARIPRVIPQGSWHDRLTRRLGIKQVRLACTIAEAALVRALVKQGRDYAFDWISLGRELDVHPGLLRSFLSRPSVDVALERWRHHRRLPKPCPPRSPSRRSARPRQRPEVRRRFPRNRERISVNSCP